MFLRLTTQKAFRTERRAWIAETIREKNNIILQYKHTSFYMAKMCLHEEPPDWSIEVSLTPGHAHVGPHFEPWVNINNGAPDHVTGEVTWYELHSGSEVVPRLIALIGVVVWVGKKVQLWG